MKLYFALSSGEDNKQILNVSKDANILASYFYFNKSTRLEQLKKLNVFNTDNFILDSGAFSAYTLNKVIDIQEYIDFIKNNEIKQYANLDDIGNPKQTAKNYEIMLKAGLKPKPVFHTGESLEYLEPLLNTDYIALGGMVKATNLEEWLDKVFNFIYKRNPKIKIHGFGMTNLKLVQKYPWFSVDSTSWLAPVAFGRFKRWNDKRENFKTFTTDEILKNEGMFYDNKMPADFRNFLIREQVKEYLKFEKHVNKREQKTDFSYITAQQTLF
tara:strand:- start:562 stop:1371 length:810 start_codon:yes stop_codon:yes gene_type:complete